MQKKRTSVQEWRPLHDDRDNGHYYVTSESGFAAFRAHRTRPNDHKSQMVLQAFRIAVAWNFVLALAVTIYVRS